MSVRPTARPEPFSVCTNSALPRPAGRNLMLARRAWNASVLLQDEISRYVFWLGSHTSMSYVFADAKPMSPVHSSTVRYGSSSRCSTSSAFAVSASSSS